MSKAEESRSRRVVLPPAVVKRIERDASASGRRFSDQVLYVLTIGHRELDHRPPLSKAGPKRGQNSAKMTPDGSGT